MNTDRSMYSLGGLLRNSLIDYPGAIASVLFLNGCNFRCPYCHNPELVHPPFQEALERSSLMDFLERRRGQIEGVVISGGEPLLTKHLDKLLTTIKSLGYRIKLDTNGSFPRRLEQLLNRGLVDYVAMDLKTDPDLYGSLPGLHCTPDTIRESIALIRASQLPYEFRTTCVKPYIDTSRLTAICQNIQGAPKLALQACRPEKVLDPSFFEKASPVYPHAEMVRFKNLAAQMLPHIILR